MFEQKQLFSLCTRGIDVYRGKKTLAFVSKNTHFKFVNDCKKYCHFYSVQGKYLVIMLDSN